jgi:hypothetical protein
VSALLGFAAALCAAFLASFIGGLAHGHLGLSGNITNTIAGIAVWMIVAAVIVCLMVGGLWMLSRLVLRHAGKSGGSSDGAA